MKQTLSSALALVLIFAVFALALTGINVFAAPIIESNGSSAQLAPLYSVMSEAGGFELIYDSADPASSSLAQVPESVKSIYAETSGLGYALSLSTSEGYTKEPMVITMAVDAEGKISGIEINVYPETRELGDDYPATYIGQDSALPDAALVAGATYSSSAFKNAVSDGFAALVGNGLIGAGVKGDGQILAELLIDVFPGMANNEKAPQYEEQELAEGQFAYIEKSMKALNGGGYAYIAKSGESSYLIICNAGGVCRAYDVEGADVTADIDQAIIAEASADAASGLESFEESDIKALSKMVSESAQIEPLSLGNVFNSVTGAYLITDGQTRYYGFAARPYGYSNMPMVCYYVLDENGAIYAMNADEFILIGEYFTDYTLDEAQYKAGFVGESLDTWTGDAALISGATVSSNAVKTAAQDAFSAFETIMQEGGAGQ